MSFIAALVHNTSPNILGSMSRRGYFPHGEGGGGGGVFQGMVAAAAAVFVSLCLMQTLCTTLAKARGVPLYGCYLGQWTIEMMGCGMPDPRPEDAYFSLNNFVNAAFLWGKKNCAR